MKNLTYVKEMLKEYDMAHSMDSKFTKEPPTKSNDPERDTSHQQNGDQVGHIIEKMKGCTKVKKEHIDTEP